MAVNVHIQYYANLREQSGINQESVTTQTKNVNEFYGELKDKYGFTLDTNVLRVAVNDEFVDWDYILKDEDNIVFIPPVSGG